MSRIDAVMIGAGQRGADCYAPYALKEPGKLRFVAVVEPNEARLRSFAKAHRIPAARCFRSSDALFAAGRIADAAFVCTPDREHIEPARSALSLGYHVLLEKPLAVAPEECAELVLLSRRMGVRLSACHGLRHTRHVKKLKALIESGELGEIVRVDHHENVSYWHMAHSYVRGNWRNRATSSPMILAKCCHDFDLLNWLLGDPVLRLSSHGALNHFRPDRAPAGAPERCTDGCPVSDTCPFYAPRFYGELKPIFDDARDDPRLLMKLGFTAGMLAYEQLHGPLGKRLPFAQKLDLYQGWPRSVVADDPTPQNIDRALREGPYGRCVYRCDNDVVDHQVVLMALASGATATLHMHGHSSREERITTIDGARGSLHARFGLTQSHIDLTYHRSGKRHTIDTTGEVLDGHGGSDLELVAAFVKALSDGDLSDHGEQALESHLLAFAAEEARTSGSWIDMEPYRARTQRSAEARTQAARPITADAGS